MTAGDILLARARPWINANRADLTRSLAPVFGLGTAWWLSSMTLPVPVWTALVGYGAAHLSLIALDRRLRASAVSFVQYAVGWLPLLADGLFALLLLGHAGTLGGAIYPLYLLLALRVLSAYQRFPAATITPFLLGPTYLFALYLSRQAPPVSSVDLVAQWSLLLGSLGFGAVAIWLSAVQQRVNVALRQELRAEHLDRDARISDLERGANDLRARMRQLHTLEEGLRVITSTLSLDEVLNQIVDSTVQMLGSTRVDGMVLSLQVEDGFEHRSFLLDSNNDPSWVAALARRVQQQQVPLIIGDAARDADLADLMPQQLHAALCVPLFVGEGAPQGTLTIVSATPATYSSSDARHLTALATQAGIAIHNAELHSQLRQQQRLLEAVVRDINDGLVVIDEDGQIVLTNPIGRDLLERATPTMPVQAQLLALATSIRTENRATLMCELRISQEHDELEQTFHAFGSPVWQDGSEEPLVAIVLHDITAQKVEEQSRTEFISMVSHELRNPLNSLNGFIKVVLKGQAGALTPLQHEFLGIADGQVELLKGRIAELLEFNRLEAGRLVLDPQWNDLSLLVAGTATRLNLQAQQNGLALVNEVNPNLPECAFDSERIGQVLNNLIENAIKATPPGGTITVRSELYEDEIWVRVCDTGVGIPVDEQSKIFQRFYRAHNRASSTGNHLGLGLAICQQIIEGHHGRIWVESEEGMGSCFTFALPWIERQSAVNERHDR
jgi:NtrC-family two-component system sensor histidine kinase KinB